MTSSGGLRLWSFWSLRKQSYLFSHGVIFSWMRLSSRWPGKRYPLSESNQAKTDYHGTANFSQILANYLHTTIFEVLKNQKIPRGGYDNRAKTWFEKALTDEQNISFWGLHQITAPVASEKTWMTGGNRVFNSALAYKFSPSHWKILQQSRRNVFSPLPQTV